MGTSLGMSFERLDSLSARHLPDKLRKPQPFSTGFGNPNTPPARKAPEDVSRGCLAMSQAWVPGVRLGSMPWDTCLRSSPWIHRHPNFSQLSVYLSFLFCCTASTAIGSIGIQTNARATSRKRPEIASGKRQIPSRALLDLLRSFTSGPSSNGEIFLGISQYKNCGMAEADSTVDFGI